jgi:hypothetical protein
MKGLPNLSLMLVPLLLHAHEPCQSLLVSLHCCVRVIRRPVKVKALLAVSVPRGFVCYTSICLPYLSPNPPAGLLHAIADCKAARPPGQLAPRSETALKPERMRVHWVRSKGQRQTRVSTREDNIRRLCCNVSAARSPAPSDPHFGDARKPTHQN